MTIDLNPSNRPVEADYSEFDDLRGVQASTLTVGLVTMGTYPHYKGGVSTWCDMLVRGLPNVRFVLVSIVADPSAKPVFELPTNVDQLITVPLWGTGEVLELQRDLSLREVLGRKRSVNNELIRTFLPAYRRFLNLVWNSAPRPDLVGAAITEMALYFRSHDYDKTMRSREVWECFLEESREGYQRFANTHKGAIEPATLLDATDAMRLFYRWLTILTVKMPHVDVMHAAAAGLCSLPAIITRQLYGTPYLLTEHGIYLRERLLALARSKGSLFDQTLQSRFDQNLTEASYFYADQIAPGSDYNHRWEVQNGAIPSRIRTIYNGPDPRDFTPVPLSLHNAVERPTVVWLGRIDPLKDLETLIRAAKIVCDEMPNVTFKLYGMAPKGNEWYYDEMLALRDELELYDHVIFGGYAASAEAAYNEGNFALLSSISEGFPYSVVEAMMCGRTVVGTAVGGVPEALEGCGFVVEPRNAEQMAESCLHLLRNPELTRELGDASRKRALTRFSLQQCNSAYLSTYQRMATRKTVQLNSTVAVNERRHTTDPLITQPSHELPKRVAFSRKPSGLQRLKARLQSEQ